MKEDEDQHHHHQTDSSGKSKRRKRGFGRQLLLLMWKNYHLRRRHWLLTAIEIILPLLLFSVLLFIRLLPDSEFVPVYHNETTPGHFADELLLKEILCRIYGYWYISRCFPYSPENIRLFHGPSGNFTDELALYVANEMSLPTEVLQEVASNEAMNEAVEQFYITANNSEMAFIVGIFLEGMDGLASDDELPFDFHYDLRLMGRWDTASQYPFVQIPGPRTNTRYRSQGFVILQTIIDRFYISKVADRSSSSSSNSTSPSYLSDHWLIIEEYPYPPYYDDNGMSILYGNLIPSFLVLSLILLSPSLVKSIVHEKETGVRELVRLMGMNRWLVWSGWFLHSFTSIVVVVTLITVMLSVGLHSDSYIPPIMNLTDSFFIWVLLLLYGISSICFCMLITTFFSRPTLATTFSILIWLMSYYVPSNLMYYRYDSYNLATKLSSCLLPNMAVVWAFQIIQMFEGRGVGVHWGNLWETGSPRDQLTAAMILLMLVLDTFIFLLLTWYIDQVNPGVYGVPLPWHFPFQRSYWCGHPRKENDDSGIQRDEEDEGYFEEEPVGLKPGIVIRNLRKEFRFLGGKTKVAVEKVSMTCYEGQCTVLLGHNGAGKTTTMSILTGVYAPSGGSASVGGWDISTNLKEAREELGLCPQHNMLFVDLTVLQHLLFFGRLKGLTTSAAKEEALQILSKLDLLDKKNMFGNQLSGGMKRKLCLAISLVGGSKVVILDEPSSGLDPESRRWVWNVVQGERGSRTFLITTHHMEEADVLGDRVAIMASGRVVCAGSTIFLKNKFGDGYTLEMVVSDDSKIDDLKGQVEKHLPSATLHSFNSGEITFKLPLATTKFASLLDDLTLQKHQLGIKHIGLSLTTMERVFLRLSEVMENNAKAKEMNSTESASYVNRSFSITENGVNANVNSKNMANDLENGLVNRQKQLSENNLLDQGRLRGGSLFRQRLKAFIVKRAIYTKRKWPLLITQALLPVLVTLMCILVDQSVTSATGPEEPLALGLDLYASTNSFVANDSDNKDLAMHYTSLFSGTHHKVSNTDNLTGSLLDEAIKNIAVYRENDIASANFLTVNGLKVTEVFAQTIPLHAFGVATTLVDNAILRQATNSNNYSITTSNYPLPRDTSDDFTSNFSTSSLIYSSMMPIALALLSASFLVFPLQERVTKAKQVQVMTGAPVWMLWTISLIWDNLAYLISAILMFILFMAFDPNGLFTPNGAPGALFLLLFLYGWASIPMAYVFSFPFQTAASGFSVLTLINIITGMMLSSVVWALDESGQPSLELASTIINWISSFIPAYPASRGFLHLAETSTNNSNCDIFDSDAKERVCAILAQLAPDNPYLQCCPQCQVLPKIKCFEKQSYLKLNGSGMGPDVLTLLVNGFIFIGIIVLYEHGLGRFLRRSLTKLCCRSVSVDPRLQKENQIIDDDVAAETRLINNMLREGGGGGGGDASTDAKNDETVREMMDTSLVAYGLSKAYFGATVRAVDGISFRVKRGECLGLLGVNGAGKTTTFNMLTGEEPPTEGDAKINGVSLLQNKNKFVQHIGYCPQFDAIIGEFTGREMIMLLGRLRGICDSKLKHQVEDLVNLVDLTECANRPSSTYSGGNKRKLSTAMALVGSPPLVFLDEPTSGVDPASRHRVWQAVTQAIDNGQSIVLTSHSMEECEALCSRIIIMSRGSLRCMGTTTHLKAKFGQGYSLQIKLKTHGLVSSNSDEYENEQTYQLKVKELKDLIDQHLPGAIINDQHKGMLAYRIPATASWSQLFSVMETLKKGRVPGAEGEDITPSDNSPAIVEDYAASDTSLEQVFLSFARETSHQTSVNSELQNPVLITNL